METYQELFKKAVNTQKSKDCWHYFKPQAIDTFNFSKNSEKSKIPDIFNFITADLIFDNGELIFDNNLSVSKKNNQKKDIINLKTLNENYAKQSNVLTINKSGEYFIFHLTTNTQNNIYNNSFVINIESDLNVKITEIFINQGNFESFNNDVNEINIAQNSRVTHNIITYGKCNGTNIQNNTANLEENSEYYHLIYASGLQKYKNNSSVNLKEYSNYSSKVIQYGENEHTQDIYIEANHNTPNATCNIISRGIAYDKASCSLTGKIFVEKNAKNSDSNFETKNLLLSNFAEINSRPQLEIHNDEVKCSHGATIGSFDEESLFYLQTRGFSVKESKEILIHAFFEPIMQTFDENTKKIVEILKGK